LAIGLLLLFLIISFGLGSKADQPIYFNHKKHLEQGLECDACHRFFKTQTFSGMPDFNTCLQCHKEPITKTTEEEKIRQFQKKGQEISWKRIYEQPKVLSIGADYLKIKMEEDPKMGMEIMKKLAFIYFNRLNELRSGVSNLLKTLKVKTP
jgi:hypothetical protein